MLVRAGLVALSIAGFACDGVGDDSETCGGKCDDLNRTGAVICGPRQAATNELGCTDVSTTDFGIDPQVAPVIPASIRVARRGLAAELAVEIRADGKRVRTIAVPPGDGISSVKWDGRDEQRVYGDADRFDVHLVDGSGSELSRHSIFRLASLADEGPGHEHPLGSDAANTDDWGRAHVIEALEKVSADWQNPVKIAYLDISAQNGGEFKPHTYHRHGECIDIRYVRSDGPGALDLARGKRFYDREATQALVDALVGAGAIEIYVDALAELEGNALVEVGGHSNHLHAMFARERGREIDVRAVNEGFVGGPCFDDSDCPLRDGFCLQAEGSAVGTCTRECKSSCPDFVGGIYTLSECVRLEQHLCMPARDLERYPDTGGCRADLESKTMASEDRAKAATEVCVPR